MTSRKKQDSKADRLAAEMDQATTSAKSRSEGDAFLPVPVAGVPVVGIGASAGGLAAFEGVKRSVGRIDVLMDTAIF